MQMSPARPASRWVASHSMVAAGREERLHEPDRHCHAEGTEQLAVLGGPLIMSLLHIILFLRRGSGCDIRRLRVLTRPVGRSILGRSKRPRW